MTHGIGFDRSYWDLPFDAPRYSYVAEAVDTHGYSTLTWDRLGVGMSTHPDDTVNETQLALEVAALKELTARLRAGTVPNIETSYQSIVHLGHSFGSSITYNLVNSNPNMSQGIILTGFSQIPDYMDQFALGANFVPVSEVPGLAVRYKDGYIAAGSAVGVHIAFFGPDDFDPEILEYAFRSAQPHTTGEILTVGVGTGVPNAFAGPVMIITGDRDVPFCGGNCMGTAVIDNKFDSLIQASEPMFPNVSVFNATVVPKAGHGLHYGYSAPGAFATMLDFLNAQV
jgi:pimeloyl-ACP methyl ester carboxylesterase